jgi:hypothetical protein
MKLPCAAPCRKRRRPQMNRSGQRVAATSVAPTAREAASGMKPASLCLDLCEGLSGDAYVRCVQGCF